MAAWQGQDPLLLFLAAKEMVFEVAACILLGFQMEVHPRLSPHVLACSSGHDCTGM